MRRQSSFGAARSEAATPRGSTNEAGFGWRKRLPVSIVVNIVGGALLSTCQPIAQSYYDWLAAGGGYYDGDAPVFHGRFVIECRLRDTEHPRACRIVSGPVGSDGVGADGVTSLVQTLAR